jgi:uncharacterized protein (DUF697 family)
MPLAGPGERRLASALFFWRKFMADELTNYEKMQIEGIKAWKKEEPGVISKALGIAVGPLAWLLRIVIPESAMKAALEGCNSAGQFLADHRDIIRDANVESISELKSKDLETSDCLAGACHSWAIAIASGEGTLAGMFGIFSAPADIPAVITLAFRSIHKIGLCYGFESTTEVHKQVVLGILAASGANTLNEKVAAMTTITMLERTLITQTWKAMAGGNVLGKEGAIIAIRNLVKQLGINLTKRKALAAIPIIGAAIGGAVNGWYISDVCWTARRVFQERWLLENARVTEITPV